MSIRSGYKVKQMKSNTVIETKAQSDADNACLTEPSFVLLFSIHLNAPFQGFGVLPSTILRYQPNNPPTMLNGYQSLKYTC
jgi:hypothetical protein